MTKERTLDELPDEVFVALGRRGMEGIILKECAYECDSHDLSLVDIEVDPAEIKKNGTEDMREDWKVKCNKCSREFIIRCKIRFHDGERIDTMVNIIDDSGKDLGWLGSY